MTTSYYCPKCSKNKKGLTWLYNRHNGEFKPTSGHIRDRATPQS
ncbi:hypothetical protein F442_18271 [Phytophthora nicotianae P10297]|uniref:Uncharacterized protein n=2 Tax=Phytophthora nicotianae TaxID=4792 RepID=W2YER9_PHYNI|nr:hypothetical protein L916_17844 [Phytophthora nicotianae]ETP33143.1 hypothetical protein F442_18271 [Phytophthora nicotianae P10297]